MARPGMNSEQARRMVRIAQFAGLGLAVAAGALWGLPWMPGEMPTKPQVTPIATNTGDEVVVRTVSIGSEAPVGIAERLDMAANRPVVESPTAPVVERPIAPDSGAASPWKYLGPIFESDRTLALVSLEGKQRIVSEGSTVTVRTPSSEGRPESVSYRAKVRTVASDFIEIEEDGGRAVRVNREERVAKVSWVKNMPSTVAGTSVAGTPLSPEARARLAQQGIDPQQIERARQAAIAASTPGRNRAMAGGENGAVVTTPAGARTVDVMKGTTTEKSRAEVDGVVPMHDKDDMDAETRRKNNEAGIPGAID